MAINKGKLAKGSAHNPSVFKPSKQVSAIEHQPARLSRRPEFDSRLTQVQTGQHGPILLYQQGHTLCVQFVANQVKLLKKVAFSHSQAAGGAQQVHLTAI